MGLGSKSSASGRSLHWAPAPPETFSDTVAAGERLFWSQPAWIRARQLYLSSQLGLKLSGWAEDTAAGLL